MGLDIYLYKGEKQIEEAASSKYPDHYFKIGYLRSSYNDGGINTVLSRLDVPGLYDIFNPNDEYEFKPDWDAALVKVKGSIELLRKKPNLRCFDVSWNEFKNPKDCGTTDEKKAIEVFLQRKEKYDGSFSCLDGHFFLDEPIKVHAVISGVKKIILGDAVLPCAYVICDGENEWYIQALEIVQENIEYVLAQPDKEEYLLHWSS